MKSVYYIYSSCCFYDIKNNEWGQISDLNEATEVAGCTVFEGKIVITGGDNDLHERKSVEGYDY